MGGTLLDYSGVTLKSEAEAATSAPIPHIHIVEGYTLLTICFLGLSEAVSEQSDLKRTPWNYITIPTRTPPAFHRTEALILSHGYPWSGVN